MAEPGGEAETKAAARLVLEANRAPREAPGAGTAASRGAVFWVPRTSWEEVIRQQVAWQPYRPRVKSPAGALVQAIRDAWPSPPAWIEAQEQAVTVDRQSEEDAARREVDEARRREWEQKPPEERIAGRLQFWLLGQRRKGREPSAAEVAAKRDELLATLEAPMSV